MYQLTNGWPINPATGDVVNPDIHTDYLAWLAQGNIPAPVATPTIPQQLASLDAANTLTQRNLREFILLATEALKLGQAIDLSVLPGVAKVAEVEAAAAVLRAQL